jgi:pyrimidine-nucleoside phosphorylase
VTDCGYAHFLADHRFAPLDAALFAYRRREGAVAIPSLAAASLLAKKLAVGVHAVGLDVRVGQFGNFGTTLESARANARLFCRAAQKLGITATAFVSTQAAPAQPWIGRGESLLALAIVSGVLGEENAGDWLAQHAADCYSMAATVASSTTSLTSPASCPPAVISVRNELERHLFAHGSSIETLRVRAREVLKTRRTEITAPTAGIAHLEMGAIRDAIVDVQNDAATGKFQDPAGVELLVRSGSAVFAGQPLARLRCDDTTSIASFSDRIRSAVRIEPDVGNSPLGMPSSMEIVRA